MFNSLSAKYHSVLDTKIDFQVIGIVIMYLLAFVDFSGHGGGLLNIILAVIMCAVFFTDRYYTVIALIVLTNDFLGTIVASSFSFCWLLILLVLARLLIKQKVNLRYLAYFFVALILCFHLPYINSDTRNVFFTISLVTSLLYVFGAPSEGSEDRKGFFFYIAVTITLIAIRNIVFGGFAFLQDYTSRLGIIGIGNGDPNFSCLILLTGVAILLAQNEPKLFVRIGMIAIILIAMVQTVSITGLLGLCILIIAYILVKNRPSVAVRNLLIVIIACLLLLGIFLPLMQSDRYINFYIQRITTKFNSFNNQNYDATTTNRSLLFRQFSQYFFSQDVVTLLFGTSLRTFSLIEVSHNTYLDLLMRFGFVGFGCIMFIVLKNFFKEFVRYGKTKINGEAFLLKILYLFFSTGLSIFSGSSFALWFAVLMLI